MCGIIGYVGEEPATPLLVQGLRDLEYRGYDSAGIALATDGGSSITVTKREGKLDKLAAAVNSAAPPSVAGIAHTRWATHGPANDENSHPHTGCNGSVAIVHNGIVENHAPLHQELADAGHTFTSATDSEVIAHLLEDQLANDVGLAAGLRAVCARLQGSQAVVAMATSAPGVVVAGRVGNAGGIVIGFGANGLYVASDLAALLPHASHVSYLGDQQFVQLKDGQAEVTDVDGAPLDLERHVVSIDPETASKGRFEHIMLKEIMEQPEALADTVGSLVSLSPPELHLPDLGPAEERLAAVNRVVLFAMGTSMHAAMFGRRYFESLAGIPAEVENASEFRGRQAPMDANTLVVSVSQSGETVDVLEAMAVAKRSGAAQITICNTQGAQTTRVADGAVYTQAGLERGVASTKTFVTSVVALLTLALRTAVAKGNLPPDRLDEITQELGHLPALAGDALRDTAPYERAAAVLENAKGVLFLGRAAGLPVAMEGALKLKEISYLHAEGYAAGEMKHGPIALIEEDFPTVAIATRNAERTKIMSNIEQVRARGGRVIAIATEGDDELENLCDEVLFVPDSPTLIEPIVASIAVQMLAYSTAKLRGCDIDQPRNLAKTVTVE